MKLSKFAELLTPHLGDDPSVQIMAYDGHDDSEVPVKGLLLEVGSDGKVTKLVLIT